MRTTRTTAGLAATVILAAGAAVTALVVTSNGGAAHQSESARQDAVLDQVVAEAGQPVRGATVQDGIVHVRATDDGRLATVWLAKVAASEIAQTLRRQGITSPAGVSADTTAGGPLATGTGIDVVHPAPDASALDGDCASAISGSASSSVDIVSARTLPFFGGTCIIVLRRAPNASDAAGALIGSVISTIADNHARPYLVTLLGANGKPEQVDGWVPGIGGDQGQGMGSSGQGSGALNP